MTQKDLFEWHIDKALREWDSLYKNDVMKAYEKAAKEYASNVENLNLGCVSDYYTLKDGDIVVKGDEFYDYDEGGIWFETQAVGQKFDSEIMYKFRRKI